MTVLRTQRTLRQRYAALLVHVGQQLIQLGTQLKRRGWRQHQVAGRDPGQLASAFPHFGLQRDAYRAVDQADRVNEFREHYCGEGDAWVLGHDGKVKRVLGFTSRAREWGGWKP